MSHFAKIENGIVTQIIVISNDKCPGNFPESESLGVSFCNSIFTGEWKQTSYNNSFRKRYAGVGYEYNSEHSTNPPFYTIKYTREEFLNPEKHFDKIKDIISHEDVPLIIKPYITIETRNYLVGIHDSNVSTIWNHIFKGIEYYYDSEVNTILKDFGL